MEILWSKLALNQGIFLVFTAMVGLKKPFLMKQLFLAQFFKIDLDKSQYLIEIWLS